MDVALQVTDVRVRFGAKVAVDGVSLAVAPGEVLGVLGPSGSGKSTLLRAIAGLERLESGDVAWNGETITTMPVHQRGFALMFQDGQLFAHRSVAQNIAYPLAIARSRGREARVAELLELVGLAGFGDRRVTDLSGGEQQRVALARSLAANPRLLLLDEPLSSLDRQLRERLAGDLRRILSDTATTSVFVTHDQDEAFAVSDRVAVMVDGVLAQVGTPREVWRRPASPQIARFLGFSTVLDLDRSRLVDPAATSPLALRASAVVVQNAPGAGAGGGGGSGGPAATVLGVSPSVDGARVRLLVAGIGEVDGVAGAGHPLSVGASVSVRFDSAGIAELP